MNPLIKAILDVARGEIGVRESNNNSGKRVQEYQAATTLGGTHWPWCSAFTVWCIRQALGKELAVKILTPSASCDVVLAWARRKGIVSTIPVPGCLGLVMASKYDATHIFIVEAVGKSSVTTIEGNTNNNGSREGNGVYRRNRPFSSRYLYLHIEKLLPQNAEARPPAGSVVLPMDNSPFAEAEWMDLYWGESKIETVPVLEGKSWVLAWKWAHWMNGAALGWNMAKQCVTIAGREVPAQPMLIDGRAWLPVRKLADFSGLALTADMEKHRIILGE